MRSPSWRHATPSWPRRSRTAARRWTRSTCSRPCPAARSGPRWWSSAAPSATRGLRTGLLTNNAKEFEDFWRPLIPLDELFDDVVDSSEVGLRKPDPRIYHLALERLGVDAPDAVFVDDAPGNVSGAERVGIRSVLIGPQRSDVPAALAELTALVG